MAKQVEVPSPHVKVPNSDPYAIDVQLDKVAEKLQERLGQPTVLTTPSARLPNMGIVTAARENVARPQEYVEDTMRA